MNFEKIMVSILYFLLFALISVIGFYIRSLIDDYTVLHLISYTQALIQFFITNKWFNHIQS